MWIRGSLEVIESGTIRKLRCSFLFVFHGCILCSLQVKRCDPYLSAQSVNLYRRYYNYRQACAQHSHAGIVFTQWSKNRSQGRHVSPINVKFGTGESPVINSTFIGAKVWEYSPQNCQNFEFWPEICTSGATRLQYFYEILSVCTRLQVALSFQFDHFQGTNTRVINIFPRWGNFLTNFQQSLAAKLPIGSKKLAECKMGRTSSITMPSIVGIAGRVPVVDEKV